MSFKPQRREKPRDKPHSELAQEVGFWVNMMNDRAPLRGQLLKDFNELLDAIDELVRDCAEANEAWQKWERAAELLAQERDELQAELDNHIQALQVAWEMGNKGIPLREQP